MRKNIIVIGASAGGIEAMKLLVGALPENLAAAVFVVVHTSANSPGLLAQILAHAGPLPAVSVGAAQTIQDGVIYVAAPDHHLVIEPGTVRSTKGPKENRVRPAVDPLFRSAAQTFGPRVIGVILTGSLDDGTAGLWAVKQLGGTTVVQDPLDAFAASMPRSALKHVEVDHCVPLSGIAPLLVRLNEDAGLPEEAAEMPEKIEIEVDIAKAQKTGLQSGVLTLGDPSNYACPECHGVLLELKEGTHTRFRCHTGHAYSTESLMAEIDEAVEEALWNAIRALEERHLFMEKLAGDAQVSDPGAAARLQAAASKTRRQAEVLRQAAMEHTPIEIAG